MIRCIGQDHWHRQGSGLDSRIACIFSVLFVTSHRFSRVLAHVAVMNGIKSSEFFMNMCSSSKITTCRKVLIVISTNDNWKNAFFSSITRLRAYFVFMISAFSQLPEQLLMFRKQLSFGAGPPSSATCLPAAAVKGLEGLPSEGSKFST